MPVKRREIVVRGKGADDPVLHPETIVTTLGRMRTGGRSRRRVYSSSGVLYNSRSSFFPLSPRLAARRPLQPLVSAGLSLPRLVFNPLRPRERERAPAPSRRQWVSSGIGNKLCSAEPARKITDRPEIRACRSVVTRADKRNLSAPSILLDEFLSMLVHKLGG